MIVNFSVQNFGSIKEKQTLSFEAEAYSHLEDAYVCTMAGKRVLKLALIYGANASGKTTLLKALNFLRSLVLEPLDKKTSELDFQPFLFDPHTPKESSFLSIEFIHKNIRYFYTVKFTKVAVLEEELYFYKPKKANVFRRTSHLQHQFTEISFGSKINIDKIIEKTLEANTLWNNTVLGGFLKTNIECVELQEAVDWFKSFLKPLVHSRTELETFVTDNIQKNILAKTDMLAILKKADLNISDIHIRDEEQKVPEGWIEFVKTKGKMSELELREYIQSAFTYTNVEFEHSVGKQKYNLPIELESEGTRRYYGFAGLLGMLLKKAGTFSIDELETSLHPDLFLHFILSFLLNTQGAQIIASTHNRELLDNKDLFRNDAIWFTDKAEASATQLYSLSDFDSSIVRNTTNVLNAYKSGRLSGTPKLGDTYLNL